MLNEADFRRIIIDLDEYVSNINTETAELEEICSILLELNLAKRDLSIIYDSFTARVAAAMDSHSTSGMNLAHGAEIERKVAYDRKGWQHKDLATAVARRLAESAVDMDSGEVTLSAEDIILKLLDYLQPSYWRVGELSKIGLNADNYCETGEPKVSLIVRKGKNL
jgi:hypothetical protein